MPGGVGYSWFVVELTSNDVPVEAPEKPQGISTGRPFTYGAGAPAFDTEKQAFPAQIGLLRVAKQTFTGSVDLKRTKTFKFSANLGLLRSRRMSFSCAREPAEYYLKLRQEDEDILLLCD